MAPTMDDCAEHVEIRMDDENRFVKDYLTQRTVFARPLFGNYRKHFRWNRIIFLQMLSSNGSATRQHLRSSFCNQNYKKYILVGFEVIWRHSLNICNSAPNENIEVRLLWNLHESCLRNTSFQCSTFKRGDKCKVFLSIISLKEENEINSNEAN